MKITKQQLKQIIKEELETTMDEGAWDSIKSALGTGGSKPAAGQTDTTYDTTRLMKDLPKVMNMLRGSNQQIQYTLLNRIPTDTLIGVASELEIDIVKLIQNKLAT